MPQGSASSKMPACARARTACRKRPILKRHDKPARGCRRARAPADVHGQPKEAHSQKARQASRRMPSCARARPCARPARRGSFSKGTTSHFDRAGARAKPADAGSFSKATTSQPEDANGGHGQPKWAHFKKARCKEEAKRLARAVVQSRFSGASSWAAIKMAACGGIHPPPF